MDLNEMAVNECWVRSNRRDNKLVAGRNQVYQCAKCSAIFGTSYLRESYALGAPVHDRRKRPAGRAAVFRHHHSRQRGSRSPTRLVPAEHPARDSGRMISAVQSAGTARGEQLALLVFCYVPKTLDNHLAYPDAAAAPEGARQQMRKRKYTRHRNSNAPGRLPSDVAELADCEGIWRQAAWYRLRRATGRPAGRPRKITVSTVPARKKGKVKQG
jgi:hypothetical protein